MKETILYIDDEVQNLEGFEAVFWNTFNILLAPSTKEAYEHIKTKQVKVIISDQRMPEETGLDFFKRISDTFPDIICIILTAYADIDVTMQALNQGGIFRYIMKPWDKNEMELAINQGLETYNLKFENKRLIQKLSDSEEKFRLLVQTSVSIIIGLDTACQIFEFNLEAERLFGHKKEDVVGENFLKLYIPSGKRESTEEEIKKVLDGKPSRGFENTVIDYKGNYRTFIWNINTIDDPSGNPIAIIAIGNDITDRKNSELALKKSEQNYREIFNATSEAIFIHETTDGKVIDVNDSMLEMFNCTREEVIGKTAEEFNSNIPPYDKEHSFEKIQKAITEGVQIYEWQSKKITGELFWTEVALRSSSIGGENKVLAVVRDISERKKAEQTLLYEKQFSENLINSLPGIFYLCEFVSGTAKLKRWNKSFISDLGYDNDELEGFNALNFFYTDEQPKVGSAIANLYLQEKATVEANIKHKTGKKIPYYFQAIGFIEANANLFMGIGLDISDRKMAEIALKESEEKFRSLFEESRDGIVTVTKDGEIADCNKTYTEMLGYSKQELTQMSFYQLTPDKWHKWEKNEIIDKQILVNGYSGTYEKEYIRKDGTIFPVELNAFKYEMQSGSMLMWKIVRDISGRKLAEQALIESEKKFKNIFDSGSDAIIIADLDLNILEANKKTLEYLDCPIELLVGKNVSYFVMPDYLDLLKERLKMIRSNEPLNSFEMQVKDLKGKIIPVEINSTIINYEGGKAFLSVIRDITERKEIQQRILHTIIHTEEKERTRFAKELHDGLGPILSTVKLYYQWLSETDEPEKKKVIIDKGCSNIEEAITTIREISNNLSPHILNNFGLCDAIEQFVEKLVETKKLKINFYTNTKERFETEIEITLYRVISELINNTLKHGDANRVNIIIEKAKTNNVLSVFYSDNGKGFDFEETKLKKNGQGLFNMENRIKTIGGQISINSMPKKGMEVKISIKLN